MLVLTLHSPGQAAPREVTTLRRRVTIGRAPDNDLVLDDVSVSARHLEIEALPDRVVVRDLHSTAGVWIDGHRLTGRRQVAPDETVLLGRVAVQIARGLPATLDFPDAVETDARATGHDLDRLRRLAAAGERWAAALLWREARRRDDVRACFEAALWATPEPRTWHVIVDTLDRWPAGSASLVEAVERADAALASWPDTLRVDESTWWSHVCSGIDEPRWRLVRTLALSEPPASAITRMFEPAVQRTLAGLHALAGLTRVELRSWQPTVPAIQQLLESTPALEVLVFRDCRFGGHPALGALLGAVRVGSLRQLSLNHARIDDEGVLMVARAEALRGLRVLELRDNHIGDRGAASLSRSPIFGTLDRLDVTGNPIGHRGIASLRTSVRIPHHALRYGPGPVGP